jgi:hypothetical protein
MIRKQPVSSAPAPRAPAGYLHSKSGEARLGGKIAVPVMAIPNTGKFSIVQDPPGALFAIFQPAMRG